MLLSVERPFVGAVAFRIPGAVLLHRNGLVREVPPASTEHGERTFGVPQEPGRSCRFLCEIPAGDTGLPTPGLGGALVRRGAKRTSERGGTAKRRGLRRYRDRSARIAAFLMSMTKLPSTSREFSRGQMLLICGQANGPTAIRARSQSQGATPGLPSKAICATAAAASRGALQSRICLPKTADSESRVDCVNRRIGNYWAP
jgi:hypothetical protein